MTTKQSQYTITYDDFNDAFLCEINNETISANFVGEILSYIAKLYDYEPKIIYTESHFAKVLEDELNITIKLDFDYQEKQMSKETVTITKEEYDDLIESYQWLCALESAGVDNWCGYDHAKEILQEWENESE